MRRQPKLAEGPMNTNVDTPEIPTVLYVDLIGQSDRCPSSTQYYHMDTGVDLAKANPRFSQLLHGYRNWSREGSFQPTDPFPPRAGPSTFS